MALPATRLLRSCFPNLTLLVLALVPSLAYAQTPKPKSSICVSMQTSAPNEVLKGNATMVSIIRNGEVVQQTELVWNILRCFYLPVGRYDVRLECDGAVTLVKRGVHVTPDGRTDVQGSPMLAGQGVKTVEYAVGGLSREEVAARLADLTAKLSAVTERVGKLEKR